MRPRVQEDAAELQDISLGCCGSADLRVRDLAPAGSVVGILSHEVMVTAAELVRRELEGQWQQKVRSLDLAGLLSVMQKKNLTVSSLSKVAPQITDKDVATLTPWLEGICAYVKPFLQLATREYVEPGEMPDPDADGIAPPITISMKALAINKSKDEIEVGWLCSSIGLGRLLKKLAVLEEFKFEGATLQGLLKFLPTTEDCRKSAITLKNLLSRFGVDEEMINAISACVDERLQTLLSTVQASGVAARSKAVDALGRRPTTRFSRR